MGRDATKLCVCVCVVRRLVGVRRRPVSVRDRRRPSSRRGARLPRQRDGRACEHAARQPAGPSSRPEPRRRVASLSPSQLASGQRRCVAYVDADRHSLRSTCVRVAMRVDDAEPSRPRSTLRPRDRAQTFGLETDADTELSMGRVDPWIGLGWVGSTIA